VEACIAQSLVLVVENDPVVMSMASEELRATGLAVLKAPTVDTAVLYLGQLGSSVAVALSEIKTPGELDGLALAKMARKAWPALRLVLTSGEVEPGPDELPEHTHFVRKPYHFGEMASFVAALARSSSPATSANRIDQHLGRRLQALRKRAGYQPAALAAALDVDLQQIQLYESGAIRLPASTLMRLCKILGASIPDFFEGLNHN
jgi:DNA-binding response OmpR family regulator